VNLEVRTVSRGTELLVGPAHWPQGVARAAAAWDASPALLSLVFGAMEAGGEIALLNTRLTEAEQKAQLQALGLGKDANGVHFAEGSPPGPAILLFTSGTTGAPKVAVLPLESFLASARAANEVLGIDQKSRFVCAMPLFHVGGLGTAFRCALAGATLVLHQRFDAVEMAHELLNGATHASLVASTLARVLDTGARFPDTVRAVLVGGGPVPKPLLARARAAGLPVLQTYGLTETCSMATCERLGEADGDTAGRAMPGIELRVDSTRPSAGDLGEILVAGPQLMRGYLGQAPPGGDGQAPPGGFFRTGDLGELDARGRLTVHARRTDLIVSGGENVYPAEVEAALLSHPLVREAAVVPAPDERWGQVGVAYVVGAAAESDLRAHLAGLLARYKIPARFESLPELPRLASGKIDRHKLQRK
jgi:O-succinylbenzoic acid--CoA ligase